MREKVCNISGTCIVRSIYLCRQLIDSVELSSTVRFFLSRYHGYHIFVHLFRDFCHSGPPSLRESNMFVQRRRFSSINLIELRRDRLSMWSVAMFSFGFRALSRRCISFLNKHAVDMFNEFLFSLGDFGKMCLPQPYTNIVCLAH